MVKNPSANAGDIRDMGSVPGLEDHLEKAIAAHSSILIWIMSWTEEPGGLQSRESQRVEHNCSNLAFMYLLSYLFNVLWLEILESASLSNFSSIFYT